MKENRAEETLRKMKQSIEKLRNRDGESMVMVDICIQNIICFYDKWEANSIEDDIKNAEHFIDSIKAYKELEEKNRKLKEHCKEQIKDKQELTTALLDSIPISLVEKKIEELKQEGNYKTLENPDGRVHFQAEPCDYKIQVLEELLEKRK